MKSVAYTSLCNLEWKALHYLSFRFWLNRRIWSLFLVPNLICLPSCNVSKYENKTAWFQNARNPKVEFSIQTYTIDVLPRELYCLSFATTLCLTLPGSYVVSHLRVCGPAKSSLETQWKHCASPAQFPKIPQSETCEGYFHTLTFNNAAVPDQNESYPGERKHLTGSVCHFLFHELIPTSEHGISNVSSCSTTKGPWIKKGNVT